MKKGWKLYLLYGITVAAFMITVHFGSSITTSLIEGAPIERKYRILIDPGHGGEDGGAISCSKLPESGYNLAISLRLKDLLEFFGADVQMTRSSDISIYQEGKTIAQRKASDLKERVHMANTLENAVLLSIHQNHFPDGRYSGAQVFHAKTPGSKELAVKLQDALSSTVNQSGKRQCKVCSGVYLMEHIRCPGVLIECGFLSNQEEEAKLRSDAYQKQLSSVIAASVSHFLSNT